MSFRNRIVLMKHFGTSRGELVGKVPMQVSQNMFMANLKRSDGLQTAPKRHALLVS